MLNKVWQTHLQEQGATFDNDSVVHFDNRKKELQITTSGNVLCDLSHLGLLEISGADAVSFLQGQVTNDVKLLTGSNAHYTAYCNPKGRLLALFLAFTHADHLHLQLPKSLVEPIAKRLRMYVLRSKVEIKDVSNEIVKFGINGPEAASILASSLGDLPSEDFDLLSLENCTVMRLPTISDHSRFEIFASAENAIALWNLLNKQCQPAGKACWDWLDIQVGIPEIYPSTQEQFVPQMLNLDALNAINYKKGCYTGQEIVARTHYLGTVKRRTFLAHITCQHEPAAGDKLLDLQGNECGQIVRVAAGLDKGFDVLAELRLEAQANMQIVWNNHPLAFKALPYKLE
ncbi:MAG TPA: folate-binding protein YgfZ [Methylophilus sp.]|nr:folate-binding protein YgfZ [Methylophilus sp.]HQQ34265.1 folate-binding protein YgfZ [Methylophilus sp.]